MLVKQHKNLLLNTENYYKKRKHWNSYYIVDENLGELCRFSFKQKRYPNKVIAEQVFKALVRNVSKYSFNSETKIKEFVNNFSKEVRKLVISHRKILKNNPTSFGKLIDEVCFS